MMRRPSLIPALALLLCASVGAQPVTIEFVEPERYVDADFRRGPGRDVERAEVMREIDLHLRGLAERYLPPDRSLAIEILDIDLAGRIEPTIRTPGEIRVLRSITSPSITLRYRLADAQRTLAERSERVADASYQTRILPYAPTDRLRYEKAMLDDWFEARIVKQLPPS